MSRIHGTLKSALAAWWLIGCGDGALVTLGEHEAPVSRVSEFGLVTKVEVSAADVKDENPTLTGDMREIYFDSDRADGIESSTVWYARRDSIDAEFSAPVPLGGWSDNGIDKGPAISEDGLTLWLAWIPDSTDEDTSDATTDIRSVTRISRETTDWGNAMPSDTLNTQYDERPRPLGLNGQVMPFSRREDADGGGMIWRTYLARRNGDGTFAEPEMVDQVAADDVSIVDGFLSQNGLTLIFKYQAPGVDGELYWSKRRNVDEPFVGATPVPGEGINTAGNDERDPWLSPDEKVLYFSSNRGDENIMNIYRAEWIPREESDAP